MQDAERMSEASFGSTISLHSIGSDGGFSPKPPSGTRKLKKNRTVKVKNQDSPYGSRKSTLQTKRTGRELWVSSIKQGVGLSNESSAMNTWNGIKSPYKNQSKAMASTSSYLLDQLLQSTGRAPKNHSRSSSYTSVRIGGNGPAYKTAEEYYDEIVELKKKINTLARENEIIQSKMHKVEEENIAKGRQIEELMNPNMQSNHLRRTLTDKKQDSSAVVTSLKHKLHSMERVVKNKDNELSKLKNEMKCTDIAELQLQMEMYYEEIQRLNFLLTEPQSSNTLQITSEIKKEKTTEGKLKKYNEAVQALADDNARVLLENNTLKQDLRKAMELNANSLNLSKDVEDMNRTELLAKISSLEQQIKEDEDKEIDTPRLKKSSSQSKKYPGKAGEEIRLLEEKENELIEELEKQKEIIKKLKEDRTHYRKLADEYRTELEKYKQVGDATEKSNTDDITRQRSSSTTSSTSTRKSSKKESKIVSSNRRKSELRDEARAATTIQRNWRKHKQQEAEIETLLENYRGLLKDGVCRNQTASLGLIDKESFDQAILSIQAAFRGHRSRNDLLKQQLVVDEYDQNGDGYYRGYNDDGDGDYDYDGTLLEDDVVLMQAAFRAHKVRQGMLRKDIADNQYHEEFEIPEPPRFRRSFDTGEPITDRMTSMDSSKRSYGRTSIYNDRDSRFSGSIEKSDSRRSNIQGHSGRQSLGLADSDDDDDDDDDDDVVIGSTSSLNSDDRFEQSYLKRKKFELNGSGLYGISTMSSIKERDETPNSGNVALKKLQRNSISWDGMRSSNVNDFLSGSEEEDVIETSKRKNSKKKDSIKRNSLETSISRIDNKTKRKESVKLADKWASSGTQNSTNAKNHEKSLISTRLSSSPWRQVSQEDDDDDDDDLVIAPTLSRNRKKTELDDELY